MKSRLVHVIIGILKKGAPNSVRWPRNAAFALVMVAVIVIVSLIMGDEEDHAILEMTGSVCVKSARPKR